ncbi:helix-turn-helix transcriptional regulator [Catenulispora pinisilvae]|uniref:helix-turn-helix transcriptional regulator n=1 Tax=Catenulispora pinisilvae TaxID=2705253 RepID=UPI001891EFF6|nr:LuxR family transcriptional regulator [Catenulispora pinisilvae]
MLAIGSPQAWQALVGREAQAERMAEAFAALASGRGAVLEIAGDPGMGKTRLLGRIAQLASGQGARVARSNGLRGNTIARQLFRDAWADVPAPDLTESDDDEVFRRIRAGLADWAADPVGVGGAVIFDDVHLADEDSTRLLARLIRTPVPGPLLMAIGHCPRRTGSVLLEALDDGSRTGTVVRVELDALDITAVNQLLSAWSGNTALDPAYLEQIRTAADGNPRNLRVLTAAGWRPELWPDSPGEDTGALLREGASMAAELDALSPAETAVVSAAAVLGGPFRPEEVAALCASTPAGLELAGILDALDDLVRADVIRHVAPGARFAFRHPLLGHVAHERAPLPTLLAAHQRALDLLKARGAAAVDLARHAEHLIGTDAAVAAPLLARGASEILPDAPETAVRWLRLALQTPVGERPSAERDALMLECCRALSAAGRFEEARALAHDVLRDDTWLTGPLRQRAYAMRVAAERQLGRYDEASAVASAAVEALPRPLTADAAELAFEYGVLHLYRGTFALARPVVQEVAAAVKAASEAAAADPGLSVAAADAGRSFAPADSSRSAAAAPSAAGSLGASHDVDTYLIDIPSAPEARAAAAVRVLAAFGDAFLGETAAAIPALVESARLVDGLPDATAARNPELLAMLGCGEMFMEGYTAASRHLRRCLTIARKGGPQQMKLNVLLGLAFIDQQTGNLLRAEQRAEEAGRVARATGAGDGVSMSEALRVGAMIWSRPRAEGQEVVAAAERAVRTARAGNGWWSGSAAMQLALVRMVSGDAAGCVEALLEGGGGPDLRNLQPAYRPMLLSMLSTAALRSGRAELARQAALDADEAAEASGLSVQRAYVIRAQAALHAAEGDHDTAAKLFEQSALGFRRANRPVQHAWTLAAGSGSAALALGPVVASSWLDAAQEVARIHGALRIEEEITDIRAKLLGAPAPERSPILTGTPAPTLTPLPAPSLQSDVRGLLTRREQEIAALVATGRRSRAIAEELFLSHRTVETHLARIYRKLNVSSRTALAHLLQDSESSAAD